MGKSFEFDKAGRHWNVLIGKGRLRNGSPDGCRWHECSGSLGVAALQVNKAGILL